MEQQWYKMLVDLVQEGIWVIDAEGTTTFMNPFMADMLGYDAEDTTGRHLFSFMDEQGIALCKHNLQRCRSGITEHHHFEFLHKNGHRIYTKMSTGQIINSQGEYMGAIACIQDITEQKAQEEQLARQHASLRQAVRSDSLIEMATTIAHEINQPLGTIAGYAHGCLKRLQQDKTDKTELYAVLKKISDQTTRAGQVLRRIRSALGKEHTEHQLLDINLLLQQCVDLIGAAALHPHIRFTLQLADNVPPIPGDNTQLQQACINLMKNAIEAYQHVDASNKAPGSCEVIIETKRVLNDYARITITDFGIGFGDKDPNELFNNFESSKGTLGIGLPICRNIIQAHQGTLGLQPTPAGGTQAYILLPLQSQSAQQLRMNAASKEEATV